VDDAKIHPGHPSGVQIVLVDGDRGGDRQPELAAIGQQGDRPDLVGRIRDWTGQPHPQRRVALGDGQSHALAVELKRVVVEADRHQKALAAWESGLRTLASTLGGLEPGVRIATQHRPGSDDGELAGGSSGGQRSTQRLIADDRRQPFLEALSVGVQQPGPDVAGCAQLPIAAVGLAAGHAQADSGGAMHQPGVDSACVHSELMFDSGCSTVKTRQHTVDNRLPGQPAAADPAAPRRVGRDLAAGAGGYQKS